MWVEKQILFRSGHEGSLMVCWGWKWCESQSIAFTVLDCALHHHPPHQTTTWGDIIWKNGVPPSSRVLQNLCQDIQTVLEARCSSASSWETFLYVSVSCCLSAICVSVWPPTQTATDSPEKSQIIANIWDSSCLCFVYYTHFWCSNCSHFNSWRPCTPTVHPHSFWTDEGQVKGWSCSTPLLSNFLSSWSSCGLAAASGGALGGLAVASSRSQAAQKFFLLILL